LHVLKFPVLIPESFFQALVVVIKFVEEMYKIEGIRGLKGPVSESLQTLKIPIGVVEYKIVGSIFHQLHQLAGLADNGFPQSPGEYRAKQARYFNIRLFGKLMGYRNRIVVYKRLLFIKRYFMIEQGLY